MTQRSPYSALGRGFLFLFSLPFAGVGVGMVVVTAWTFWDYQRMQRWEEVPCRIMSANLESHRGDKSTTYKVLAEFRYEYAGRVYTGTRVSPHSGSDNIGSFHQRVFRELDEHRRSDKAFRCYVDPEHPDNAILYRRPRWEMMLFYTVFMYAFGGAGLVLMSAALFGGRRARRASEAGAAPWQARDDWAEGKIRTSNRKVFLTVAFLAFLANLAYLPAAIVAGQEWLEQGNPWTLLTLVFPVIGLGMAWWAIYAYLQWLKYGESVFEMASVPGVVGGRLAGVVHVSARLESDQGFHLRLACQRTTTTRSGKKSQTTVDTVWEAERQITQALDQPDPGVTAIPVLFGIPYEAPSTGGPSNEKIDWKLDVRSAQSGVDYSAVFEVPVFKTPESRPGFALDESLLAPYTASDGSPPNV